MREHREPYIKMVDYILNMANADEELLDIMESKLGLHCSDALYATRAAHVRQLPAEFEKRRQYKAENDRRLQKGEAALA